MSNRFTPAEIEQLKVKLRADLPPGSSIHTQVLHVTRSGMSREIAAYLHTPQGITSISWAVAAITGQRFGDRGGVIVQGAGMDMTFHLAYSLSRALYPDGHRCTGSDGRTPTGRSSKVPRCPSNDHSNDYGRLAREYDSAHPSAYDADNAPGLSPEDRRRIRTEYVNARQEWIAAQHPRLYSKRRQHSDGGYAVGRINL